MTTPKEWVLDVLTKCDVELPNDGLTREKIRCRGPHFRVADGECLAFLIKPTLTEDVGLGISVVRDPM